MTNDQINQGLELLENDMLLQNFIAQSNARYILLNTEEKKSSMPAYTINDDRLNMLAFQYLNLGCSMAENQQLSAAAIPLEKGASILETVHGSRNNQAGMSNYYGTVSSLAYYVSFQYSKSFILINKFESSTVIARLIRLFLLRDFKMLNEKLYELFVDPRYDDAALTEVLGQDSLTKIHEIVIARSLDGFVKYLLSGHLEILEDARNSLRTLKEVCNIENDPGTWWVARLLLLVSDGIMESSVWPVIASRFDLNNHQVKNYVRSLVFQQPIGIYEFFVTQRRSLPKLLNAEERGCVVSIPTSSGKTRIAEIAILHSIQLHPECKVLYIAPFRSLAFEIENSMDRIFENSGITVSHLYGGSTYSRLDQLAIDESSLIIATPEKAKAILRGNENFVHEVKLVILDEGHLLGNEKRLIGNEIFFEELRRYVDINDGRFLVLSAVLPNATELAQWLTGSVDTVYCENWRPSDERIGVLDWNGGLGDLPDGAVNLRWESQDSETPSFNNRFVVQQALPRLPRQRKTRFYPADKNEAIAAAAFKLNVFGPVLIYVGIKSSVFVMARAYIKALGENANDHPWKNQSDWRAFELASQEAYGMEGNDWLSFAKKGILCHNSDLHGDVRLPLERLMRTEKPLAVIATSTLGQGVNLGVSTVIFASLRKAADRLNERDFWNIAGRAGRAFVDHEGKILVARDTTGMNRFNRNRDTNYVRKYFDKGRIDIAQSGIMLVIKQLKEVAAEAGVDFEHLIGIVAENRLETIDGNTEVIQSKLDLIDDTLLSLLLSHSPEGDIDLSWMDDFFSRTLAVIQAAREEGVEGGEVVRFLGSRMVAITEKVGNDRNKWHSIVGSGIPLQSDLILEERLEALLLVALNYIELDRSVENRIKLLSDIEAIVCDVPVLLEQGNFFMVPQMNQIRELWLKGVSNAEIFALANGPQIVTNLYSYSLPWVLNGIAKKMRNRDRDAEAELIEELAVLVEAGLPSIIKVKVYQAGIRSRVCANEIGSLFDQNEQERSISSLKRELITDIENLKLMVSETSAEWLDMLSRNAERKYLTITQVGPFKYGKVHEKTKTILARSINGKQFLMSPDLTYIADDSGNVNFNEVNNISGIDFRYDGEIGLWNMVNNNPYVKVLPNE